MSRTETRGLDVQIDLCSRAGVNDDETVVLILILSMVIEMFDPPAQKD